MWGHPKNGHWRWCCATGMCSMRQSHSTHCSSWGYDLITLAAVLWHHTAALKCRPAALGHHTAALSLPQVTPRSCSSSKTVTESCCMCHTTAAHLCVNQELNTQKKGIMCITTTQHNLQSWLCAVLNCSYFVMHGEVQNVVTSWFTCQTRSFLCRFHRKEYVRMPNTMVNFKMWKWHVSINLRPKILTLSCWQA